MAEARSRFGALKTFRQQGGEGESKASETSPTVTPTIVESGAQKATGRPTGKRSNPEYEPTTVLLRKKTKRQTARLLEDLEDPRDFSELIESLLAEWISGNS